MLYKVSIKALVILCCFLGLQAKSQGFILETGEPNKDNIARAFAELNGSYFFQHTEIDTNIGFAHSVLSKIDTEGNIIGTVKIDSVRLISLFSKDNFLFSMGVKLEKNTPAPKEFSSVFYKIDSDLQLIATNKLYTPDCVFVPYDFISYNTDTLIYVGWKFNAINYSTNHDQCVLFDNDLQPLFTDSFPHLPYNVNYSLPKLLHVSSYNSLFITGLNAVDYNPPFYDTVIFYSFAIPIKKSDFTIQPADTIAFQEHISGFQTEWFATLPKHALNYDDSTFLFSVFVDGAYQNNQAYNNMGYILLNKNLVGYKLHHYPFFHPSAGKMPAFYNSIDIVKNGDIYFAGTYNCSNQWGFCLNNDRNIRICILKTDTSGTIFWQKMIGGDSVDYFVTCMLATSDGGVLIGATIKDTSYFTTNPQDITKALVIKLDSTGSMVFTKTITQKNAMPLCYPNPATDRLYISNISEPAHYSIYAVSGKLVDEGHYLNKPIPISTLPKGMYLLHLQTPTISHTLRFVKE